MILRDHRGSGLGGGVGLVASPIHLLEYQCVDDDISRRIKKKRGFHHF